MYVLSTLPSYSKPKTASGPWKLVQTTKQASKQTSRSKGSLQRIWSLGMLGEGSGWDLRIRPAPPAPGNLGTWKSGNLEIWGPGNPEMRGPTNPNDKNSKNSNPFCPKCRQGLD